MFGRARTFAAADGVGHAPGGYERVTALIARPDTPVTDRLDALRGRIGKSLNGESGLVIRYDAGDPARSLTGPVKSVNYGPVSSAIAQLARPAGAQPMPNPEFSSLAFTDPQLDPWNALLWQRMQAGA